jgi:mono/diheme cytochrome c family protein
MARTRSTKTQKYDKARHRRGRGAWWAMAAAAVVFGASLSVVAQQRRPGVAGAGQGGGINGIGSSEVGADFSPKEPVKPLSPKDEQARFILPPGYRLELVMSEPQIISPGAISFDGNGRMFVAELRSYMLDADATDEKLPTSRISMHESTKGDGVYDRHTVFVDKVSTPRFITPLDGNAILTMETDTDEIYKYTDTDNDGVADKKELFYKGAGRIGQNLEHQPSGFIWGMDNWIYSTYNAFRLRWTPKGEVLKETTAPNGGQWGLTQDDYGKVWFVDAGGERGPINFQTPIQYGAFNVDDQFDEDWRVVYPAYMGGHADTQGGMGRVRMPLGVLNHFTATCGQDIYRGHTLPDDMRGDLLFAEPVGRLIRRAKVTVSQGITRLDNAYSGAEFITSTDPLFRPVNMVTAPDGSIYISDMYHGIIQESNWTRKGTYLRKKIEQYGFDKVINHGRIWRLVHDSKKPDFTKPNMQAATPAQLVGYLSHPNGWWRDSAQRILVLRQDASVAPALTELAKTGSSLVGRFHALWALEGLGKLDAALLRELLKDASPQMRVQAIRASESLVKAGDKTFDADVRERVKDGDASVVIQALLTLNLQSRAKNGTDDAARIAEMTKVIEGAQAASKAKGVKEIGDQLIRPTAFTGGGGGFRLMAPEQLATLKKGEGIYTELCYSCHGSDGMGEPLAGAPAGTTMAPPLAGSSRVTAHKDYVIRTVLHGLTGPVDGSTYSNVMIPMNGNDDEWIASIASFVRNNFGNQASFVSAADVARVRAKTTSRTEFWTVDELEAAVPSQIVPHAGWKAMASHNAGNALRAVGNLTPAGGRPAAGGSWSTGARQAAGMWLTIDMAAPATVAEIHFDSPAAFAGGGGFGGPGGPGGPRPPGAGPGGPGAPAGAPGAPPAAGAAPAAGAPAAGAPAPAGQAGAARPGGGGPGGPGGGGPPTGVSTHPRAYEVHVSLDGQAWGLPVATGKGAPGSTTIVLERPVRARYIRITQTGTEDAPAWSVARLQVYGPPAPAGPSKPSAP